jgi:S1-C subfamily serine protease
MHSYFSMSLIDRRAIYVGLSATTLALGLAAQNPPALDLQKAADYVTPAVVQLLAVGPGGKGQNQECAGTGFLVNEDGYILTNAHVVEKGRECLAQSPGAKILARLAVGTGSVHSNAPARDGPRSETESAPAIECDLVAVDDVHDLALMRLDHPPRAGDSIVAIPYAHLDSAVVPDGARVRVTGHPTFAWVAQTQGGEVIGRRSLALLEGSAEQSEMLILNFSMKVGSSGSPVYRDARGGVVGIVERRNTAMEWQTLAVPIHYAIDLLNKQGVKWYDVQK